MRKHDWQAQAHHAKHVLRRLQGSRQELVFRGQWWPCARDQVEEAGWAGEFRVGVCEGGLLCCLCEGGQFC